MNAQDLSGLFNSESCRFGYNPSARLTENPEKT
jgi:hypothetical protein